MAFHYVVLQELDLTNPASFRDLGKPMGAQTPDRLKQFEKRYNDWDDPQGKLLQTAVISAQNV